MILYYKYYLEIKNRFILFSWNWGFSFITCYFYKETLLFFFIDLNKRSKELNTHTYFIFTSVTEVFYVYFELIIFISNQLGFIFLLYNIILFISSGLYSEEFKKLKLVFKFLVFSWITSLILLYTFIAPLTWSFFLSFQKSSQLAEPISLIFEPKIDEYFHYFLNLYYLCLINCQGLILIIFFIDNFVNTSQKVKKTRKLFYLIFFIFSTCITPPDVFSQISISIILILCFEVNVFYKCFSLTRQPVKAN